MRSFRITARNALCKQSADNLACVITRHFSLISLLKGILSSFVVIKYGVNERLK